MIDIIIIGAGPGGMDTAIEAQKQGKNVLLIEKGQVGGTCLNRGCIPTKALLRSAHLVSDARAMSESAEFRLSGQFDVNHKAVIDRKDEVVNQLREGASMSLSRVQVLEGEAELIDSKTVRVNNEDYTADTLIIATGSEPSLLNIPGASFALTSDDLMGKADFWVDKFQSVIIIGGGVIGIELATILRGLYPDAEITVIEYCKEILPPFDKEIAKRLRMSMTKSGIKFVTGAAVTEIKEDGTVVYERNGKMAESRSDKIIMATGRRPVFIKGLEAAGIDFDAKGIKVDESFQTNIRGVYAIGDVNGKCMLAHAATAQGKKVLGLEINTDIIPSAVFSEPECSMVGLTEDQCKARELDYEVKKSFFRANGKAVCMNETEGIVKILIDKSSGEILGTHICGAHASDLIAEPALAMVNHLNVKDVLKTIHAHPTLNEVITSALNE